MRFFFLARFVNYFAYAGGSLLFDAALLVEWYFTGLPLGPTAPLTFAPRV